MKDDLLLTIRHATEADSRLYWEWANDPIVRTSSFTPAPIPWEDHVAWFEARLGSPSSVMYIVSNELKQPVGQVRFDTRPDGDLEIGISLAAPFRGRRLSRQVLGEACRAIRRDRARARIWAHVRPENQASLAAFLAAGFERRGVARVGGHDAIQLELVSETG